MTAIEFHVNQADKLHYTCRLVRKAYRLGTSIVVTAEPDLLSLLDAQLWQLSSTEFLPHCHINSAPHTVACTPIILADTLDSCSPEGVLINAGQRVVDGFERFERVIEVASSDEDDRLAARARWKFYQERGYRLKRHDTALESPAP